MATIDIRIQRIDQLFDSLDPSPFSENEKALSRDAEDYIVDFAGEYGRADPLRPANSRKARGRPDVWTRR